MQNCGCNSKLCKHTPFVHLHLHTDFSLLDGASKSDSYIKLAKEYNHPAITILDHGNVSGGLTHFQKCKTSGIKPILGMEAYLNDNLDKNISKSEAESTDGSAKNTHQSIIVKDQSGYVNLNKLTYLSFTEGYYYKGRITTDWLFENKKGLIVTSSCMASKWARMIEDGKEREAEERIKLFLNEFGEDFYAELQFNEIPQQKVYNKFILKMIKKYDIKPIITGDVHYAYPEDNRLQDVLIAVYHRLPVGQAFSLPARHLSYASVEDLMRMNKEFGYNYPESFLEKCIENTLEVSNKCTFDFETDIDKYPKYEATQDVIDYFKTSDTKDIITKLSHAKLKQKLNEYKKDNILNITPEKEKEYYDRLNYELKVIDDKKMLDYFLVVWELVRFCEKNSISLGPGRGCFVPGTRVKMIDDYFTPIETINIDDRVVDAFGKEQKVINKFEYDVDEEIVELEFDNGKIIRCTSNHEILTLNRSWVKASELTEEDEISEITDHIRKPNPNQV